MHHQQNEIILKNITKKYAKHTALDNISLEIKEGMFGLLGHNGAGKTTLMKLITTLVEADKGTITVNGYDVVRNKMEARSIIGFLPQEFNIYPQLTGFEFLDYIARLNNIGRNKRKELTAEVLQRVNLWGAKDKKVGEYSGGMKRRLGIAQAIIKDPRILIVDEPTAGLDPEERIRFRTMLVELSQQKVVILSTHIVEDISASCEKIALLEQGIIKYVGSPIDFVSIAEGKVWEISVKDRNDIINIKNSYPIISFKQTKKDTKVRVIADKVSEVYIVKAVDPNLEDAYIYHMEALHRNDKYA